MQNGGDHDNVWGPQHSLSSGGAQSSQRPSDPAQRRHPADLIMRESLQGCTNRARFGNGGASRPVPHQRPDYKSGAESAHYLRSGRQTATRIGCSGERFLDAALTLPPAVLNVTRSFWSGTSCMLRKGCAHPCCQRAGAGLLLLLCDAASCIHACLKMPPGTHCTEPGPNM